MRKLAVLALSFVLMASVVSADSNTRVYTRPTLPGADALKRLNLQMGWRAYLPVDGSRDGIASLQVFGPQVLVRLRSGTIVAFDAETGKTMWSRRVGNTYRVAHDLAANYNSIFGYDLGTIFALDRINGQMLWSFELPAVPSGPPAADGDRVYVPMTGNRIVSYRLPQPKTDNELLVKKDTAKEKTPGQMSAGEVRDARGYATATEAHLRTTSGVALGPLASGTRAMQAMTAGRELPTAWDYLTTARIEFAPVTTRRVDDDHPGFIIIGTNNGTVIVSLKSEQSIQYKNYMSRPLSAPLVEYGGVAFITTEDNYVTALNVESGTTAWRFSAGGPIVGRPDVTDDDIYLSARRGGLTRLKRTTGDFLWRNSGTERFLAASKKWVYARGADGQLQIIDRTRGTTQAGIDLRDFTVATGNDFTDRVFLAANDGTVICLRDRDNPLPEWNKKPADELPSRYKRPAAPEAKKDAGELKKEDAGELKKEGDGEMKKDAEMKKDGGEMKKDAEMKKDEMKKDEMKKDDKDMKKDAEMKKDAKDMKKDDK